MKKSRPAEQAGGNRGDTSSFTGEVTVAPFFQAPDGHTAGVAVVAFSPGARTHWHRHAGGQVLHVVSGRGATQERGGDVEPLAAGDMVSVDPGVWHWHGSDGAHPMTHVSIAIGVAEWGDAVDQ